MSTYSFRIKKGKYQLDLITTDRELLSEQFEMWIRQAGEYARQRKEKECKAIVNSQIKREEEITKKNIEEQLAKHPVPEMPKADKKIEKEQKELKKESVENKQDEYLDIFYAPPKTEHKETITEKIEHDVKNGVFENILEHNMQNPQTELSFKPNPSIKKDSAFLNFISSRKIEKKIDYLLLTAYYFAQYEQRPRFTLKQLNSKLMQNLAVIMDHSVLQEAINRDYIECLPDLTGLVGASEYRLTAYGEKTILDE